MRKIAIAGASGFVGQHLLSSLSHLTDSFQVVAMSRSCPTNIEQYSNVEWKPCDMFSILEVENAIEDCDVIIYLIHSMQPSAKLDQANFMDYDLVLADNLGRAAKVKGVNEVIYLGGLVPEDMQLSMHLESRLEVETVLKQYFEYYTFLRSGLILGDGGSSFQILKNLVSRLPILVCPAWTKNLTSPVTIEYIRDSILYILQHESHNNVTYDLGASDNITYEELLKLTAKSLKLKRLFLYIQLNIISFSRLWVSLFSGAPRRLVYPLLESLSHSLRPRRSHLFKVDAVPLISSKNAIETTIENGANTYRFNRKPSKRNTVRSLQRFENPNRFTAKEIAIMYMQWLPRFMFPFIKVYLREEHVEFSLFSKKIVLLRLTYSKERSSLDRQLFYITGGMLSGKKVNGRLEFREVRENQFILAAIHEFRPALPWPIYRYTQAIIHLFVMKSFGQYILKRKYV